MVEARRGMPLLMRGQYKNKRDAETGQFVKGMTPWNKGGSGLFGELNPNYRGMDRNTCGHCGNEFRGVGAAHRTFCSRKCTGLARIILPERPCEACGVDFKPNHAGRRFCSLRCASISRIKSKPCKAKRVPNIIACENCGAQFQAPRSAGRRFCSYPCFIQSGGARRAGLAAAEMKMKKYGAKKDANHREIFDVIERYTAVKDLSNVGRGIPDGIAWINGGWQLFDVKNPKTAYGRRGLNKRQTEWLKDWRGGPVYLIYSVEEAEQFATGKLDGLKREDSGWAEYAKTIGVKK